MVFGKEESLVTYTQQSSNRALADNQFYLSTYGGILKVETKGVGAFGKPYLDITEQSSGEDLKTFIRGELQRHYELTINKQEGSAC